MVKERQIKIMKKGLAAKGPIVMDKTMLKQVELHLENNPESFLAYCARGILYFNYDFEKSVESFSYALSINPFSSDQYYNRGRKFLSLDENEQAFSDLTMAVRLDNRDSWKWHFLGVAFFNLEKYQEAIECFLESIKFHNINGTNNTPPEVEWIWMSYIKLNDYEKAKSILELVTENTPVEKGDTGYKTRILLKKGVITPEEYESTINYESDSHASTSLYGLAQYYQEIENNKIKTLEILERILEIKGSHHAFAYKMAKQDYKILIN